MNSLAHEAPLMTFYNNNTAKFPRTRYQGSKSKIVDWIIESSNNFKIKKITGESFMSEYTFSVVIPAHNRESADKFYYDVR